MIALYLSPKRRGRMADQNSDYYYAGHYSPFAGFDLGRDYLSCAIFRNSALITPCPVPCRRCYCYRHLPISTELSNPLARTKHLAHSHLHLLHRTLSRSSDPRYLLRVSSRAQRHQLLHLRDYFLKVIHALF